MRGKRHSTFSRTAGFVLLFISASFVLVPSLAAGHHLGIAAVEVFVTITGSGTSDPFALFFDKSDIILGPPPVFVNVTFTNVDTENSLQHNFSTILNGTFYTTPLLQLGETGWVEFWINNTGNFPYWCEVGNHREDGMEGVFIVTDTGEIGGPGEAAPSGVALRAYWIGLIGIFSMIAVILVSYFVIKYESRHHTDQREHRRRRLP